MGATEPFDVTKIDELMSSTRLICENMNIGLLIHHIPDVDKVDSIRFIYANEEASRYTDTDLTKLIGKPLLEAFPELDKTDVPAIFAEVVRTRRPANIGILSYSDENVKDGQFAVKAFPMPSNCVGVAFENVTSRKRLESMIKEYNDKLREKNDQLEKIASRIYSEVAVPLRKIQKRSDELKEQTADRLPEQASKELGEIARVSGELGERIEELIASSRKENP